MPQQHALPQLGGKIFLTDGGLETELIYIDGRDLPHFASITLLASEEGRERLRRYYRQYAGIALAAGAGFILESATWRASPDWAAPLGLSQAQLDSLNREAIRLVLALRDELRTPQSPMVVSGCIGPRGDGYDPALIMRAEEAHAYHQHQAAVLAEAGADIISAITMTNINEAIGVVRAASQAGLPSVISFTLETDGRLPTGDHLGAAIAAVDDATDGGPAYYMINCAHPSHFADTLAEGGAWVQRIRGLRANASRLSHAELEACTQLDDGNPAELGTEHRALLKALPHLRVLGGCCGTDHRHVAAIAAACLAAA